MGGPTWCLSDEHYERMQRQFKERVKEEEERRHESLRKRKFWLNSDIVNSDLSDCVAGEIQHRTGRMENGVFVKDEANES